VRVGVFDLYWSTLGGGEQFAGGIAAALAERHEVELIGPDTVDHVRLGERLRLDLSSLPMRQAATDDEVSAASHDYDVFVNCTYMSPVVNRAKHGVYVVHFPGPPPGRRRQLKDQPRQRVGELVRERAIVVMRSGFLQSIAPGAARRTDGLGT